MRNLAEYPITLDEAIDAVQQEFDSYMKCVEDTPAANRPIGGIHALALQEAINRLKGLQFAAAHLH